MYLLPTETEEENYSFEAELDGATYILQFNWNDRASAWFLSLSKDDGTKLASGIKLTTGTVVFDWLVDLDAPIGRLYVYDSSLTDADPGRYDLADGQRCQLLYIEYSDLELLAAEDVDAFVAATVNA
jgi:hypothetical protein